jgi:hypothetical protein
MNFDESHRPAELAGAVLREEDLALATRQPRVCMAGERDGLSNDSVHPSTSPSHDGFSGKTPV